MNKRSAPRFPVTLDVTVTFPGQMTQTCSVRDYCSGGMYLLCERSNSPANSVRQGESIQIEFDDPFIGGGKRHHTSAKVVRLESHGLGVAFSEQNAEVVIALSQLGASQSAGGSGVAGTFEAGQQYGHETVAGLITAIRNSSTSHFEGALSLFFDQANDALFDAAAASGSNTLQSAFFGAMNELKKGRNALSRAFLEQLSEQFEILTTPGYRNRYQIEEANQGGLSLVDSNEFDNWLTVRSIASQLEERLGEELEAMVIRFEEISANPIKLENNPAGPFVLASIFSEMLEKLVLEEPARKVLYEVVEKLLGEKLPLLCNELNQTMISQGILPVIEKKMEVVKLPNAEYGQQGAGYIEPTAETATQQVPSGQVQARQAGGGAQPQPHAYQGTRAESPNAAVPPSPANQGRGVAAQSGAASSNTSSQPSEPTATAPVSPTVSYTRSSAAGTASPAAVSPAQSGSQAVQELVRMRQPSADVAPPVAGYYSSGEVVQALGQLDQAMDNVVREGDDVIGHITQLSKALKDATGDDAKALSESDQETVTYVGGMFSSIHSDQLLAEQAKPWFLKLEVPLLKAGILDPSLLEDVAHPAREMLNRLEEIGDLLQNDDSPAAAEARTRIEKIIGGIGSRVESEPDVFNDALGELNEVKESVESNYEDNVKKLIQQCEKEKRLTDARQIVLDELNKRLGKRDVPNVVLNLLDSGWKNLLLRTLLRSGSDSAALKTYLNVVDGLTSRLTGGTPYKAEATMGDGELLEWIERMLSMISSDEAKNAALLGELQSNLSSDGASVEKRYVPALITKTGAGQAKHAESQKPAEVAEDVWQLMLEDAKQLTDREAFSYKPEDGKAYQVNLVWRDGDKRFVFTNNLGNKALDVELGEVANSLYEKSLSRMNEKELSVTERATFSFLQKLHGQIAYQANHDALTGLLNRKAFELELEKSVESAKAGKAIHVLGYFDLDRFNIINTTCGHAEGDTLLTKVADVAREVLPDGSVVARLGGDEFGIILPETSRVRGLKVLTDLHDSIRDIRFACDNNEFKVTCSMGVTEVNEASDTSGRLLSAVDSATFTAKDNGRDNIQIHNVENERISSRRHILDWVGRINVLFDKQLIQFRCQKIAPLHKTINSRPQYEILLDVHDEQGNKVPLDEFIVAAERYNRITDIDTWVVNRIFDWLEAHSDKLDRIGSLAVNISGSSLGNRYFLEEVEKRLTSPGFPAEKICFELAENIAMSNVDSTARFMQKLKETGCRFSLDDFGSGTSSYAYLRSLPIDYLKIDGTFVKDIATNTSDYAVVKSINEIGHVMGKQTVAENVEDDFAYQLLSDIGIDFVQGFGVEKPIPLEKLFS